MIRRTFRFFRSLFLLVLAGWCALVALYSPIFPEPARVAAAVAILFITMLFFLQPRRYAVPALLSLAVIVFLWSGLAASNQGDWQSDVSQVASVEQNGDELIFHNVRDLTYRTETDYDVHYKTKKVRISELSSVDLFASYWAGKSIAHLFVSFGFNDRDYISVSIEARKTKQQSYSTLGGFFRNFNLVYIVAEERDLVGVRTRFRQPNEQVYLVRSGFNRTRNTKLLLEYVKQINRLAQKPRFYNTLTTNCTTQILNNAQVGNPTLRYSWRTLLSGYTPDDLYLRGMLDSTISFEELMQRGLTNPRAQDVTDVEAFSRNIRTGVPRPPPMEK